ncbi:MAG: flagellar type III secretion system pore protein FliP [Gammaproteobacteria bacterium]|jgi:flagellar biosynthesis protein FliP
MSRCLTAIILLLFMPLAVDAAPALNVVTSTPTADGGQNYSLTIQILLLMTVLSLIPGALLMMTSLARILIVFHILRQAMGTHSAPPNMVLVGLAVFLTFFIMSPVFNEVYETAWVPYSNETISQEEAFERVKKPFHEFMLAQTRETDLAMFTKLSGNDAYASEEDVPFSVLMPAFATSEIKTGFQIGFLIFIPFLIVDLVVASILMSMGMMMLSPMIISLPFKIMLFILVDGWALLMGTLASSFYV